MNTIKIKCEKLEFIKPSSKIMENDKYNGNIILSDKSKTMQNLSVIVDKISNSNGKLDAEPEPDSSIENSTNDKTSLKEIEKEKDEEMKAMITITIHSDLPELKNINIEKVLCGRDVTWEEFLQLFQVQLDPNMFVVRGSIGRCCNLKDKVGEYVKMMKRQMKVYKVRVEHINPPKPDIREYNMKRKRRSGFAHWSQNKRSDLKRIIKLPAKLIDTNVQGDKDNDKFLESSSIVQNSEKDTSISFKTTDTGQELIGTTSESSDISYGAPNRKIARKSLPIVPYIPKSQKLLDLINRANISASPSTIIEYDRPSKHVGRVKLSKQEGDNNSKNHIQTLGIGTRKGRRNEPCITVPDDEGNTIHTPCITLPDDEGNNSFHTPSSSIPEVFDLKPMVIKFLGNKISNENMLRIRQELMDLKSSDDYFKLTCISPLAAGLLEQMFCRTQI